MLTDAEIRVLPAPLRRKAEQFVRSAEQFKIQAEQLASANSDLTAANSDLAETNETLKARLHWSDLKVKQLEAQLRMERIRKYGPSSDKLNNLQLALLDGEPGVSAQEIEAEALREPITEEDAETEIAQAQPRKKPKRGLTISPELPREEIIVPCKTEECTCGKCGKARPLMGYEERERLHVEPAKYTVQVYKLEKFGECKECREGGVATAAMPPQIIPHGLASNEMVVDVAIKKYVEHQPLYRQQKQIERDGGVELSRKTMSDWMMEVGFLLQLLVALMLKELLEGGYIQADETRVSVQTKEKSGKNHTGFLWSYSRPGGPVVFDYRDGRGREGPRKILQGFKGVLQTDEYSVYESLRLPNVKHMACMAHVRRKFVETTKENPQDEESASIVLTIKKLYGIEAESRGLKHSPEQRQANREEKSRPLMEKLKSKIKALREQRLPKSPAGEACGYALNTWDKLETYLSNGAIEIDNNWCENSIRPIALGRKNWLHIGSKESAPKFAAIISIIETCRRFDVPIREYFLDVLPKLANGSTAELPNLTPMAWKAARKNRA